MLSITDLSQKESFPGSEFKPASIWTCWMLMDRQMQSAFMPEVHRWISKLTARHLQGPPGDLLITTVKETVIYIYKTVVCDRVLTLYRPCAYPGAVLRHATGPTGPRNSSRSFSPFNKSSLPGSSKSRCSRKQTKPSLSKINNSTLKMKLFLSKGF